MTTKIDGTNGIIFPDSTTQATAAVSVGVNQTWQNVTSSRATNNTYTNSTGKPIMVNIFGYSNGTQYNLNVSGNPAISWTSAQPFTGSAVVPAGATYIAQLGMTVINWYELR